MKMRKPCMVFMVFMASLFGPVWVVEGISISGIWQGKLVFGSDFELTIQFEIKQETDGSYSAMLNTPGKGGIKNVPASSVTYEPETLKLEIKELNGSFEGVVRDSFIDGTWSQEGTSFPLRMTLHEEPELSQESMEILKGKWEGDLDTPTRLIHFILGCKKTEQGDFLCYVEYLGQSAPLFPASEVILDNGTLSVKVDDLNGEFKGQLNNEEITGQWSYDGQVFPLSLKRGEVEGQVTALGLPQVVMDQLLGHWYGEIQFPRGTGPAVFRFEKTEQGDFVGFFDHAEVGELGIPINEAKFEKGTLILKINKRRSEYEGQLSGNEIIGRFIINERGFFPLSVKKGKAPVKKLGLSEADIEHLLGKWKGEGDIRQGKPTLIFTFEKTEQGDFIGYLDMPEKGFKRITVSRAWLEQGILTLKLNGISAEYRGRMSGDKSSGQWSIGNREYAISLQRLR
jgi:hypothetical protein